MSFKTRATLAFGIISFSVFACYCIFQASAAPSNPSPKPANESVFRRLDQGDMAVRRAAARELKSEHAALVRHLCETLEKPFDPGDQEARDRCEVAAHLLRDLRAVEALPVLIQHVEMRGHLNYGSEPTIFRAFPCGDAIVAIGHSAIPAMVSHLVSTPADKVSDHAIELYAHALIDMHNINEGGPTEAVAVISRARERKFRKDNLIRLEAKLRELTKGRN